MVPHTQQNKMNCNGVQPNKTKTEPWLLLVSHGNMIEQISEEEEEVNWRLENIIVVIKRKSSQILWIE